MFLADISIGITSWWQVLILVCSGLVVGFINTLSAGGTIISMSIFMLFGLPPAVANGTNRIAVLLQNLTSVYNFHKSKIIDWKCGWKLAIPTTIGSIVGAVAANYISSEDFNIVFGFVAIIVAITLIINPKRWLKGNENLLNKPPNKWLYPLFFFIGIYGGLVHIGVGFFLLAALVFGTGHELVKSNALKSLLVLAYIPFSLIVFIILGNVSWQFGIIHAIGNIIGAEIASKLAIKKGAKLIRYMMIAIISVIILQLFGVIDANKLADFMQNL